MHYKSDKLWGMYNYVLLKSRQIGTYTVKAEERFRLVHATFGVTIS